MNPPTQDLTRELVEATLATGLLLTELVNDLADALVANGRSREESVRDLLEMLTGSLQPVVTAAGEHTVRRSIGLLGALADRTMSDLHAALEMSRRQS